MEQRDLTLLATEQKNIVMDKSEPCMYNVDVYIHIDLGGDL